MEEFPENITPHMVKGIKSFNLCVFLMGLEGWRRGLDLTFYHDMQEYTNMKIQRKSRFGRSYSLSNKDKIHYFYQSRGDLISNKAVKIAQSKQKTKKYLKKAGVSILSSVNYNKKHSNKDILNETKNTDFPLIIKPTYGTLSKGVVLNIKNLEELKSALEEVRNKQGYKSIVVEKYFEGDDIRLYVVKDQVVAAIKRVPAKVIGDGKTTISNLIDKKNKSREVNPYLNARKIKKNKETIDVLDKQGYNLNSILEINKTILVKKKSNMNQGVDLYDITDTINYSVKKMAIDTINSLPSMDHGSIDMLYDGEKANVIEVNASANISLHMFPTAGKSRNVMESIIDYYFPETINKKGLNNNMYYDYLDIVEILKKNYTNYIQIRSLQDKEIKSILYNITCNINYRELSNWIRKHVTDNELYGFIKKISENKVSLVVGSTNLNQISKFEKTLKQGTKKIIIENIETLEWKEELNTGFLIY